MLTKNLSLIIFILCSSWTIHSLDVFASERLMPSYDKSSVDEIAQDQALLTEIATEIISRVSIQKSLGEKVCKHNKKTTDTWKSDKTRSEAKKALSEEINTGKLKTTYVEGLAKKTEQAEFNEDILKNPQAIAEEIIQKGTAKLDRHGKPERYGIIISADLGKPIGTHYYKKAKQSYVEEEGSSIPTTRAFISFDIDDIVGQILSGGRESWKGKDLGFVTTLCPERSQKK